MDILIDSFAGIFNIIILLGVGFVLAKRGWFSKDRTDLLVELVTYVAMPCTLLSGFSAFDLQTLIKLTQAGVLPLVSTALSGLLGVLLVRVFKPKPGRRAIIQSCFYVSNAIFIGIPVNLALFGEISLPYTMICYVLVTTYFWLFASPAIAAEMEGKKRLNKGTLKRIMSPPLLAFLLGAALVFLGITLPKPVLQSMKYLGDMTTPLAMLFIGATVSRSRMSWQNLDRDLAMSVVARFIFAPLLLVLTALVFPADNSLMFKVFFVQSAMPTMAQTAIMAQIYGADAEFAAITTTVTTLLGLLVIPLYMWIFSTGILC